MIYQLNLLRALLLFLILPASLLFSVHTVQAETEKVIQVGIRVLPPFVLRNDDGTLSGLSIDLWNQISRELKLKSNIQEMTLPELLKGLETKQIEVGVAAITVTAERELFMDFTHPFHSAGLGIAVNGGHSSSIMSGMKAVFSLQFFQALMALFVVLALVACMIWFLERKANPNQFGGSISKGLGSGFWWSAVTMTTVGYGDKAPVTFWGRSVAIVWMFASVITISGFTATIASVFTLQQIQGEIQGPKDLPGHIIGTVNGSTGELYARQNKLHTQSFDTPTAALQSLDQGLIDAVVYDQPILRYLSSHQSSTQIKVLPSVFERQDYALGLTAESKLRESMNGELLKYINSQQWQHNISRYLGE